jgi:GntR family histidine utilization transcriptional repressor
MTAAPLHVTWQSVQAEARRRMQSREWPPGAQIPHEADLTTELGCARATVNRALRELAKQGLLDRRRKAGTRVPLHPVRKATFDIPIIRADIEGRGLAHGYPLIGAQTAWHPADIATRLGLDTCKLLHILALHSANAAPFCLEDRWINPAATPGIAKIDLSLISANEWLVENTALSSAEVALSAQPAPAPVAARLNCPPARRCSPLTGSPAAQPSPSPPCAGLTHPAVPCTQRSDRLHLGPNTYLPPAPQPCVRIKGCSGPKNRHGRYSFTRQKA